MSHDEIRIARHELFERGVDEALSRERAGRERVVASPQAVSPVRRLLLNPMFHLPAAALLAGLATSFLLGSKIVDIPSVRGEVILVNADPFDAAEQFVAFTVGTTAVYVDPIRVELEEGDDGQAAFASIDDIAVGTHIEAVGLADGTRLIAAAVRPASPGPTTGGTDEATWAMWLLFPFTALMLALGLLIAEGMTTRNWIRMVERSLLGGFLAALFALLAFLPAGLLFMIADQVLEAEVARHPYHLLVTIDDFGPASFLLFTASRAAAWACLGAAVGLGMNIARTTRAQLRNSVIGGALGGAFGGLFFDPIDRFFVTSMFTGAGSSRLVGLLAVGLSIGIFVALVERLARDAWLRVRTGPLAGKSFILYKTPTIVGSAPQSDVYLYKDADIDGSHVAIHRVGSTYEIEDLGSRTGTTVGGAVVRRRRLVSGDQIVVGSTILDFEERQKRGMAERSS
jgi:hypothetical protein